MDGGSLLNLVQILVVSATFMNVWFVYPASTSVDGSIITGLI